MRHGHQELEKLVENGAILYPVDKYIEWFSKLDNITKLQVIEGPVGYIGELCRKAVELNYTQEMFDRLDSWYQGLVSLLPENRTKDVLPLLDKIVNILKEYLLTQNESYYQEFMDYKNDFFLLKFQEFVDGVNHQEM